MDKNLNFQKHILIVGKTEMERRKRLAYILGNCDIEYVVFPKSMRSFSDYLNVIRSEKLFPHFTNQKENII